MIGYSELLPELIIGSVVVIFWDNEVSLLLLPVQPGQLYSASPGSASER